MIWRWILRGVEVAAVAGLAWFTRTENGLWPLACILSIVVCSRVLGAMAYADGREGRIA